MKSTLHLERTEKFSIIFIAMLLCIGTFHEYLACIFSIALIVLLFFNLKKNKELKVCKNIASITIFMMTIFYAISPLWAIDSGMALMGFVKFLPVPLFMLGLMQDKKASEEIKQYLPYVAAGMTVISAIGMQIPMLKEFFSVAGRLAGFFQYPNTFALVLLVAELLLFYKKEFRKQDYAVLIVLFAGILYSGSRTVFVLALLANVAMLYLSENKKTKKIAIGSIVLVAVIAIVLVVVLGEGTVLERFAAISWKESTFVGRLLYFRDALPVIIKNPFGLGYMGYYYIQQSIQTGVYAVRYVHNDFLQILLDIGWIPCGLILAAFIKAICSKKTDVNTKIILIVFALHSCFDFDLQFIAVFCLLLVFLGVDSGKEIVVKRNLTAWRVGFGGLGVVSLYLGLALTLYQINQYETSYKLYPGNTQAATVVLMRTDDLESANSIAERIIKRNEYVTLAYSVKARHAYSQGDFGSLIQYKNYIFETAPFAYEEYEEYCYMLLNGIGLYTKNGDMESAEICKQELIAVREKLNGLDDRLSNLGKQIKDQPQTKLPADIESYIEKLEVAN